MKVRFGGYTHADHEAAVSIDRRAEYGPSGQKTAIIDAWNISGILQADDQAALTAALIAMEAGYEQDNQDLALLTLTGSQTAHHIRAADCEYVRCSGISYPVGTGPEYTTYRNYLIRIEAKRKVTQSGNTPAPGSIDDIESYTENISYAGNGGPIKMFAPVISGPWTEQTVNTHSPVVLSQSGTVVWSTGRGRIPPPLFADRIMDPRSDYNVSNDWPKTMKPVLGQFAASWSYKMTFMGSAPSVYPVGPS